MAQPPAPLLQGPPYPPTVAGLGGTPAVLPDVPVSAVFMALFACTAVINMTILIRNRRRGHKFMISMGMFMFSVARVATLAVRVAWAADPRNAHLALAGTILVNAGVLVLYIINFLLAQRILRARRPSIGWHPALRVGFRAVYVLMAAALGSAATIDKRASYSGQMTYFYPGLGACGETNNNNDAVAAVSPAVYASGGGCNKMATIH